MDFPAIAGSVVKELINKKKTMEKLKNDFFIKIKLENLIIYTIKNIFNQKIIVLYTYNKSQAILVLSQKF